MDNILDLRSDSDDEQRAPRVSNDSGAIDLTNSDDETPAVRGVAATPSSAAMAWVAPPAPAPRITESPVAPRPADDDDDDEDFLAFFSSRRGPAPSPPSPPPPPPSPPPAESTLLRPTLTREESVLDKKGPGGQKRELLVHYYAADERILDEAGRRKLFDRLTRPKSEGGEGLGVKWGTAKSWCAGRCLGRSYRLRYSVDERRDEWGVRPGDEHGTATNQQIWLIGERIVRLLGLKKKFDYAVVQIYKVDDELDRILRDDYEAKAAAATREGRAPPERGRSYRKGIGAHTDEEQDPSSPIVCLSLYANPQHSRPLTIKPSKHYRGAGGPVEIEDIELADGSLYALMPPTNEWWRHELKPRTCTRVSITFRRDRPPEVPSDGGDEQSRLVQGSTVGSVYRVTPTSCTCMSFARKTGLKNGTCKHMRQEFPGCHERPKKKAKR